MPFMQQSNKIAGKSIGQVENIQYIFKMFCFMVQKVHSGIKSLKR